MNSTVVTTFYLCTHGAADEFQHWTAAPFPEKRIAAAAAALHFPCD